MSRTGFEMWSAVWIIRWERIKYYLRFGPFYAWLERRRVRREMLALPGVDDLVRDVMDKRYGKYGWRVSWTGRSDEFILEASVIPYGGGTPYWGPIGPLTSIHTRKWLASMWMSEVRGVKTAVSHAKDAPYKLEPPEQPDPYADTQPDEGKQP